MLSYLTSNTYINEGQFQCSSLMSVFVYVCKDYCDKTGEVLTPQYLLYLLDSNFNNTEPYPALRDELVYLINEFPQPEFIGSCLTNVTLNNLYFLKLKAHNFVEFMTALQFTYTTQFAERSGKVHDRFYISKVLRNEAELVSNYSLEIAELMYNFCDYCESDYAKEALQEDFIYSLDTLREVMCRKVLDTNLLITNFNVLVTGYLVYVESQGDAYASGMALSSLIEAFRDSFESEPEEDLASLSLRVSNILYANMPRTYLGITEIPFGVPTLKQFNSGYTTKDLLKSLTAPVKDAVSEGVRLYYLEKFEYSLDILERIQRSSLSYNAMGKDYMRTIENFVIGG